MTSHWLIGAGALLGGWGAATATAWRFEHRLLFGRPAKLRAAPPGPFPREHLSREVWLRGEKGAELRGVITRPLDRAARHTLLWFGGRNEDVRWTPALAGWLGPDFAVASFAYRGHLGTRGRASERLVVSDGLRAVHWLQHEAGAADTTLMLAGRSLGSAVALQVAARLTGAVPLSGLLLLSPMDSVRALVRAHPLLAASAWALRSPLDSMAVAAAAARCPTLMLLAETDRRVPHAASRRLATALGRHASIQVQTITGTDHRSLPRSAAALAAMAAFAREVAAASPQRTTSTCSASSKACS
jgi:uncharacterized protein